MVVEEPDLEYSEGSVEAPPENFHTLQVLNSIKRAVRYNRIPARKPAERWFMASRTLQQGPIVTSPVDRISSKATNAEAVGRKHMS